jgi:hypothetical protein
MSSLPSLKILNLLSDLLDQQLHFNGDVAELNRSGLRSKRVGLSIHLLGEEIQSLSDSCAGL